MIGNFLVFVCLGSFVSGRGVHPVYKTKQTKQDVCTTPECTMAAAEILKAIDVEVDPCEDFYSFACGGWMEVNDIPEGKSKWGRFYELRDQVDNALKDIVTSPDANPSVAVTKLKTMFAGCMDTDAIEDVGLKYLLTELGSESTQGGWPMVQDNWNGEKFEGDYFIGNMRSLLGVDALISSWVTMDDFNTEQNVLYIDQPSLGLPLSMYLDLDSYADYISAYKTYMVETAKVIVRELGSSVTEEQLIKTSEAIFDLEQSFAIIMTPASDRRNSTAMYNPMTVAELKEQYNHINWEKYLAGVFDTTGMTIGDEERVIIVQPDYFEKSDFAFEMEDFANYLYWRSMMAITGDLTKELGDIAFQFKAALSGVTEAPKRWQTCTSKSVGAFGFAAAHEYVLANFDEEAKYQADQMVEDLRASFEELVSETDWMDSQTQAKAIEKADQMLQLIGYPDWLLDPVQVDAYYETAPEDIFEDEHFINTMGTKRWNAIQDLITLRSEPKRDVWLMHPAIVNAWYSPNHNTITFPAGILQPPFFKGGWPRYLNYGAMGMVIGHEITHGFDDQGRQYDGTGSLSPWWSDETIQAFSGKAQCFIDQYSNYSVPELFPILGEEDSHLNGKNTQGENIADNGGIHESFRAYLASIEVEGPEPALPGLQQFSPEQMFFISNAQVWCELQTPESLLGQVLGDPHSPGKFRVIGPLGNSEDFQNTFNCPAESPMNRVDKCKLW